MVTLEKIDQVVERTGVSFEAARDALNACDGDVIEAIINIEKSYGESAGKGLKIADLIDTLKEYVRKGNVSKIIVENDGEVILNLPVTIGAIGIILAPVAAVLGAGAAAVMKIQVKIQDHEGNIIDINKITAEKIEVLKKKGEELKNKMTNKDDSCNCGCGCDESDCDCDGNCDCDCDCEEDFDCEEDLDCEEECGCSCDCEDVEEEQEENK